MASIFLSYARKDTDAMYHVRDNLRKEGLSVWTDEKIEIGTRRWQAAIEKNIVACRCMVVILSPNAKSSDWVNNEIAVAQQENKRIFPVVVKGSVRESVPIDLATAQLLDLRSSKWSRIKGDLVPDIRRYFKRLPVIEMDPKSKALLDRNFVYVQNGGFYVLKYLVSLSMYDTWRKQKSETPWFGQLGDRKLFRKGWSGIARVTWPEAAEFCISRKIQLPTEREWFEAVKTKQLSAPGFVYEWTATKLENSDLVIKRLSNPDYRGKAQPGERKRTIGFRFKFYGPKR